MMVFVECNGAGRPFFKQIEREDYIVTLGDSIVGDNKLVRKQNDSTLADLRVRENSSLRIADVISSRPAGYPDPVANSESSTRSTPRVNGVGCSGRTAAFDSARSVCAVPSPTGT